MRSASAKFVLNERLARFGRFVEAWHIEEELSLYGHPMYCQKPVDLPRCLVHIHYCAL